MTFEADGKSVHDITKSETGVAINDLAFDTVRRFHKIIADSEEIDTASSSAMSFVANNNIVFIQFLEFVIGQYKMIMAHAYQESGKDDLKQ